VRDAALEKHHENIPLPLCVRHFSRCAFRGNRAEPVGTHYHLAPGALGAWQTTESQFEIWANPAPGFFAIDGTQHLEILSSASASSVFQTIPTTLGQAYTLSFFHSPRPAFDSVLTVFVASSLVGTFNEEGSAISAFDWQEFSATFTATGATTTITFSDTAATAAGTHIDDVRVAVVPEPTSTLLACLGFGLLASRRNRKAL
jgi:hypothetical protein